MTSQPLRILSLSLDRGLLDPSRGNEAQLRQLFYCQQIPLRIVHLVKALPNTSPAPLVFEEGMRVVPCSVAHWSLFLPRALWMAWRLIKNEKFDAIQVQEPYFSGLIGACLSVLSGLPLLVGLYSDEVDNPVWLAERPLNRLANLVAKGVLRCAHAARSDSQAVAQRVGQGGYCPITYIPFLITHAQALAQPHPKADEMRAKLLQGKNGPLLLAVSRLEPEKNMPLMLAAMAQAAKTRPDLVLAIAGTGRMEGELKSMAERLLPGQVRWLGWYPAAEMGALYHAADLMLISSDRESAARVLSESLLCGTPVLSTDTAGAREVVDDGQSGKIVPVGDQAAFARAILDLTADANVLRSLGQEGARRITARMTGPAVAEALRNFYNQALGRSA